MQINPVLIASDGLWGGFQPCLGLVDMITSTPNPTTGLGNFTEIPKPSVIRTCTDYNSLYLHDGNALAGALEEPTPLLKVRCEELDTLYSEGVHELPLSAVVLVMLTDPGSQAYSSIGEGSVAPSCPH